MGPLTRRLYEIYLNGALPRDADPSMIETSRLAARQLIDSAHFLTTEAMLDRIYQIVAAYPVVEFSDKMPSESVVIELEREVFLLGPDMTLPGVITFARYAPGSETGTPRQRIGSIEAMGHWRPKTRKVGLADAFKRAAEKEATEKGCEVQDTEIFTTVYDTGAMLATFLELTCEPRLTECSAPPRAYRRQAQRVLGEAVMPEIWQSVRWTVGDTIKPGTGKGETGQRRPYHLVRAHWRSYGDRHTPRSEQRPGHPGWWVWIESHHSGHPDFGVVGHTYQPKLSLERSSRTIADLIASRT